MATTTRRSTRHRNATKALLILRKLLAEHEAIAAIRSTHGSEYARVVASRREVTQLRRAITLLDTTDLRTRADKGSA